MIKCFISCLTQLIANREDFGIRSIGLRGYRSIGLLAHRFTDILARKPFPRFAFCVLSFGAWAYTASAQTPVFKGEKRDILKEIEEIVLPLLGSQTFYFVVMGIGVIIGLLVMYNRKKDISRLEVQLVKEDTWFITRDDNNRVGIVVSVNLSNSSARGVRVVDCKLSGYSARERPEDIYLVGPEGEQELKFPEHTHFGKEKGFYLGPASSETLWCYYESRAVTMRNVLQAPFTIRDSEKKRKTIRAQIPRQADQIAIYREMAKMW